METKVIAFLACVAVASAGLLPPEKSSYLEKLEDNDSHPNYEFSYNVADYETGDVKSQQENRDGDNVQGQYTLNDADGYKRIVDYSVNGESGFRAVVRREQLQPAVLKTEPIATTSKPIVKPQPILKSAPLLRATVLHHHQPTVYHPAPVVHLAAPTAQYVHSARATTTLLKSAPTVITTHHSHSPAVIHHHSPAVIHHSPAVVHHAPAVLHHAPATSVVHHHTPSGVATPHHHQVSYVHYH